MNSEWKGLTKATLELMQKRIECQIQDSDLGIAALERQINKNKKLEQLISIGSNKLVIEKQLAKLNSQNEILEQKIKLRTDDNTKLFQEFFYLHQRLKR